MMEGKTKIGQGSEANGATPVDNSESACFEATGKEATSSGDRAQREPYEEDHGGPQASEGVEGERGCFRRL